MGVYGSLAVRIEIRFVSGVLSQAENNHVHGIVVVPRDTQLIHHQITGRRESFEETPRRIVAT